VPSVINSYAGVRGIDTTLLEAARTLDSPRVMLVREVLLPGAAPMIFTGLRLSLQACWTTLVAGELIGAIAGWATSLPELARHLSRDDPGRHGRACASPRAMTKALEWVEHRSMPWRWCLTATMDARHCPVANSGPLSIAGTLGLLRMWTADRTVRASCSPSSCRRPLAVLEKFID
jgi:hypothetical protein